MEQKIDPAALPDMVAGLTTRIGKTLSSAEQEKMHSDLSGLDIHDIVEYTVPAGKGWPDSVSYARTVSTGQGQEITRVRISRIASPPRPGKRAVK